MSWHPFLLLLIAAIAANAPFFIRRVLFVYTPRKNPKQFAWQFLEVIILYFVVGLLAWAVETQLGQAYRQSWEFYVVTFCLFIVLAYPGFVYCYLWRKKH